MSPEIAALERHMIESSGSPSTNIHSGVYVLIDAGEVVYVGASCHCEQRISTHREQPARAAHLPQKDFDRAIWMRLPERVLPDYEGALIRAFLPKYNSRAPLDRGNDDEIMRGLDIAHLAGRDWRSHFDILRKRATRIRAKARSRRG